MFQIAESEFDVIVSLLIKHGAKINARNRMGMTPLLDLAYENNDSKKYIFDIYLKHGADVNARSNDGETALHLAARSRNKEIIDSLLKTGVSKKNKDKLGRTALHFYLSADLMESEKSLGWQDDFGQTPLHYYACSEQPLDSLPTTVQHLARYLNIPDKAGRTPLHWAAFLGKPACLESLIRDGAKMDTKDKQGCTPLDYAIMMHQHESVNFLQKKECTPAKDWQKKQNAQNPYDAIMQKVKEEGTEEGQKLPDMKVGDWDNNGIPDISTDYGVLWGKSDGTFKKIAPVLFFGETEDVRDEKWFPSAVGRGLLVRSGGKHHRDYTHIFLYQESQGRRIAGWDWWIEEE